MDLLLESVDSPIGAILLVADAHALRALEFADHEARMRDFLRRRYKGARLVPGRVPADAARRMTAYFAGEIGALDAIRVELRGTAFQCRVWRALREILPGTTVSYRELAQRIGAAKAIRAVGAANGANPISLVVPCHRVIGTSGDLTGYGGGLPRKAWLIRHEAHWRRTGSADDAAALAGEPAHAAALA